MLILKSLNREPEVQIKISSMNKLTVGRSSRCDFKLDDPRCSSIHCSLRLEKNGRLVIKDLGSTNGTFINEHLVQESFIYIDDQIKIGDTIFTLDKVKMSKSEIEIHTSDVKNHQVKGIALPLKKSIPSKTKQKEEESIEISLELGKKQLERQKQLDAHKTRVAQLKKLNEENAEEDETTGTSKILNKIKSIFKK